MRKTPITIFKIASAFVFAVLLTTLSAHAQTRTDDIVTGELYSRVLSEERIFEIRLPDGYQDSGKRYHVLYVLDADFGPRFDRAVEDVTTAASTGTAPEMIIVGIRNTERNRDMIPAVVPDRPESGGGPKFLQFIGEELIPHIDESNRGAGNG